MNSINIGVCFAAHAVRGITTLSFSRKQHRVASTLSIAFIRVIGEREKCSDFAMFVR